MRMTSYSKLFRSFGTILLIMGVLFLLLVSFEIGLNTYDCQGGVSPVPAQGCGYVPNLVLFAYNYYSMLVVGMWLVYIGSAFLLAIWFVQRFSGKDLLSP